MANTHRVTGREACIAVLRAVGTKPLTANEIATAVVDSKVVKGLGVTGSTPKATLGAPIFKGAKEGRIFKRVGSGSPAKFSLRADAPESDNALVAKLKPYVEAVLNGAPEKKAAKPSPAKATTAAKKKKPSADKPKPRSRGGRKRSSARSAATA